MRILLLFVLLVGITLCTSTNMTDDTTFTIFEQVFPPSDQTTLVGTGSAGIALIMNVLNRTSSTGCPAFTTSQNWTYGENLFKACMWAVLGQMANTELEPGGAFATFNLNTHDGTVSRGLRDRDASRSSTILSTLIITLLLALGIMMVKHAGPTQSVPSAVVEGK